MKLSELMVQNDKDIKQTTRESGWKARECHAIMWIRMWGDKMAEDISREMVEDFVRERRLTHAEASIRAEVKLLQRAYNLAIGLGQLEKNPAANARVRFKPARRHQVLSHEDEKRLFRAYKATVQNGEVQWLVEKFALLTGLRLCEQAYLRPRHIQGDILEVPHEGKTGSRLVPLCKLAIEIAHLWIHIAREVKSDWLFFQKSQATSRHRAAEAYVRRVFRPACRLAGLDGLQRRDLRRTFATRLVNAGKPIYDVQHLLGHTNPDTTQIYARVDMSKLRETVAAIT